MKIFISLRRRVRGSDPDEKVFMCTYSLYRIGRYTSTFYPTSPGAAFDFRSSLTKEEKGITSDFGDMFQ